MSDLSQIRREYKFSTLSSRSLDNDPFLQFKAWLDNAISAEIPEATAMALATSTPDGKPSSRIVLLKEIEKDGLIFYTNYESKKGRQIQDNPYGALLFYWAGLERQVRIEGKLVKIQPEKSDDYYYSRPEGGKIGAWASPQSQPVPNRTYLEKLQEDYEKLFKSRALERPRNWGGFKLIPQLFEFWQGRENRLHDRFEYTLKGRIWEIHRLAP